MFFSIDFVIIFKNISITGVKILFYEQMKEKKTV